MAHMRVYFVHSTALARTNFYLASLTLARSCRELRNAELPSVQVSQSSRASSIFNVFHTSTPTQTKSPSSKRSPRPSFTKVVSTPELDPRYAMLEKLTLDRDDLEYVLARPVITSSLPQLSTISALSLTDFRLISRMQPRNPAPVQFTASDKKLHGSSASWRR